ncbi:MULTISPECIES: hypothetical protein [unclassified Clostridium]
MATILKPIATISKYLDYSSQKYFSRAFVTFYGISPYEYRKK